MYGLGLKKLGEQWNLKDAGGALVGTIEGFPVALSENASNRSLVVHLSDGPEDTDLITLLTQPLKKYGITSYRTGGPFLWIVFHDVLGKMKGMGGYIATELPALRRAGFTGGDRCSCCGEPMAEEADALYLVNGCPVRLHERCAQTFEAGLSESEARAEQARKEAPGSSPLAPLGALLGGIVGAIPWVVISVMGYVASIAAMLIALGASYGHKLFGGRPGKPRLVLVIVITLLLVPVAQAAGLVCSVGYQVHTGEFQQQVGIAKSDMELVHVLPLFEAMLSDAEARPGC